MERINVHFVVGNNLIPESDAWSNYLQTLWSKSDRYLARDPSFHQSSIRLHLHAANCEQKYLVLHVFGHPRRQLNKHCRSLSTSLYVKWFIIYDNKIRLAHFSIYHKKLIPDRNFYFIIFHPKRKNKKKRSTLLSGFIFWSRCDYQWLYWK